MSFIAILTLIVSKNISAKYHSPHGNVTGLVQLDFYLSKYENMQVIVCRVWLKRAPPTVFLLYRVIKDVLLALNLDIHKNVAAMLHSWKLQPFYPFENEFWLAIATQKVTTKCETEVNPKKECQVQAMASPV